MQVPKVVLLIFVSGKVVLTGAKKVEDVLKAFKIIYPVLYKYRKQTSTGAGQNIRRENSSSSSSSGGGGSSGNNNALTDK